MKVALTRNMMTVLLFFKLSNQLSPSSVELMDS